MNNREELLGISLKFKNLLLAPRYLEQLRNFIGKMDEENKLYELEWKIISDCFKNISAQKLEENSFNDMDNVIDENKIDKDIIFLRYLFFNENIGNNYDRLKVYKNEKKDKYELEIEEIEKNIQGRLTEGLSLIKNRYYSNERIYKYNEFLEKGFSNLEEKYIIDNKDELTNLLFHLKDEVDKLDYSFLENIILDEKFKNSNTRKNLSVRQLRKDSIKCYLKHNYNIQILFQLIFTRNKIIDYNDNPNLFSEVLEEFGENKSLARVIEILKEKTKDFEKELKEVFLTVDQVEKSLIFAEKILKLSIEPVSEKKKKVIDEEYFKNKEIIEILSDIEKSDDKRKEEIKLTYYKNDRKKNININFFNIKEYIKELQNNIIEEENEEKRQVKKGLLIELIKFKENIKAKVEL